MGSHSRPKEDDGLEEEMKELSLNISQQCKSSYGGKGKVSFAKSNLNMMWEDAAIDKVAKRILKVK